MNDRDEPARVVVRVHGWVQGVGFRWFVQRVASRIGLAGSATNLSDGSVEVIAEGPRHACEELVGVLDGDRSPGSVRELAVSWGAPTGMLGFRIR